jgi:hypothetical protein
MNELRSFLMPPCSSRSARRFFFPPSPFGVQSGNPKQRGIQNEHAKFMLLPENGNHDVVLFPNLAPGYLREVGDRMRPSSIPSQASFFRGRHVDMEKVVKNILEHRRLVMVGFFFSFLFFSFLFGCRFLGWLLGLNCFLFNRLSLLAHCHGDAHPFKLA